MQIGKLVRDKIPELIERSGKKPIYRILNEAEYKEALEKKLDEEVAEWHESKSLEELIDIIEVLEAIRIAYGYSRSCVSIRGSYKNATKGGFGLQIFLEEVKENV